MSGHSKWSTIKRKKGATDAKRGKIFTKIIRELTVAARDGGGDPETNSKLRTTIATAKAQNMPNDNIDRAVKRGTGEIEGVHYEAQTYEGYGPGGAAVLVDTLTDSKLRTVSDIRHIFSRHGGSMGEAGCVAWNFDPKGIIVVDKSKASEDELMEWALEAGAEDIRDVHSRFEIITDPASFEAVRLALEAKSLKFELAELTKLPKNTVKLAGKDAETMLKLLDAFEDNDDVQKAYSNSDIDDEVLESLAE